MEWLDCQGAFIEGDVIRWRETAWQQSRRKSGNPKAIGERLITAEVLRCDEASGFVTLFIRQSKILSDHSRRGDLSPLNPGETIRRKAATLNKGSPERLLWSDESARAVVSGRTKPEQ
jgi:hypothetical protein